MGNENTVRSQVSDEEWQVRTDLAACYRAIAMHGWDDLIFTHVSARVPGPEGCVLHTHTRAGVAVSAQAEGLLPISQTSLFPYATLAYHDYEGIALNEGEKPRLVADLGSNSAMILRNHGLLTTGVTIADAFLMMYMLETACQIQIMAQSSGGELTQVPTAIVAGIKVQAEQVTKGLGGALVWPGLLRKLDRRDPSFRE